MKGIKYILPAAFWIIGFSSLLFAQKKAKLTDTEIASVALVANQIPIAHAKLAKETSKDEAVLKFADMIIQDHMGMMSQLAGINKRLKITPKDNHVSQQLFAKAAETKKTLSSKSGKSFDVAYINNQISYHRTTITSIQELLSPEYNNGELNEWLQNLIPALNAHLEQAIKIQHKITNV